MVVSELLERGLSLFNTGRFYDAHEVWEDLWRETPPGPLRSRYQGLVQAAVAFHHIASGNALGGLGLLPRARHNLELGDCSEPNSVDLAGLSGELQQWLNLLEKNQGKVPQILPPFPRIRRLK
jgi:hypothetical protein